jgi:hypothetical protein
MLGGHATGAMPLFSRMGLGDAKTFNALSSAARFDKIEATFAKLEPSIQHFAHTMSGLTSAAKDTATNVLGIFAQPVYEKFKNSLENGLAYFAKNETAINAWATRLGNGVAYAFEAGQSYLRTYGPTAIDFGIKLYDGIRRAFDWIKPHIDSIVHAVEMLGGAAVGAKLASPAVGLASKVALPALEAAGVSGFATAGIAAVALAAVVLNVGAAFVVLSDTLGPLYEEASKNFEQIKFSLGGVFESISSIWKSVSPALILGVETFGTVVLGVFSVTMIALDAILSVWAKFFDFLSTGIKTIAERLGIDVASVEVAKRRDATAGRELERATPNELTPGKAPIHNTTINHGGVKIEIKAAADADPGRIAQMTVDLLIAKARHPTSGVGGPPRFDAPNGHSSHGWDVR